MTSLGVPPETSASISAIVPKNELKAAFWRAFFDTEAIDVEQAQSLTETRWLDFVAALSESHAVFEVVVRTAAQPTAEIARQIRCMKRLFAGELDAEKTGYLCALDDVLEALESR